MIEGIKFENATVTIIIKKAKNRVANKQATTIAVTLVHILNFYMSIRELSDTCFEERPEALLMLLFLLFF